MNLQRWSPHVTRVILCLSCFVQSPAKADPNVLIERVPQEGLQPQMASDGQGGVRLLFFTGDPAAGNLMYVHGTGSPLQWSGAVPVNNTAQSAIAVGNIRGGRLALGDDGTVHVAWNGSSKTPGLWYSRLRHDGQTFEPQRNLLGPTCDLDGGCDVAAGPNGRVAVVWHAAAKPGAGEAQRRVWLAESMDVGETFAAPRAIDVQPTGACGCCQLSAVFDGDGRLHVLYRGAVEGKERGVWLLSQEKGGSTFSQRSLDRWPLEACPMTTAAMRVKSGRLCLAWENDRQIFWSMLDLSSGTLASPQAMPGKSGNRRYPALAVADDDSVLLAWTEGVAWGSRGTLAWQVYDAQGHAANDQAGRLDGEPVPPWSLVGAAKTQERFVILY